MKLGIVSLYLLSTFIVCNCATAQISSDGTLSTDVSTNDDINFLIQNGDRTGDNLFHSFSEFSIPNLGVAYFNNDIDVVNIFSRVTGGNISEIQGLIRANGTANLFLINPAGIIFGENASLDIGGSFFATTAESVVFGDGIEFSAIEPQAAPILTINITPGLQMGANPGDIVVQGNGHNLRNGGFPFGVTGTRGEPQISVNPGNTIALIGGEITLDGGLVVADSGNIELGAIGTDNNNALVSFNTTDNSWTFNYDNIDNFAPINMLQRALLDTSGTNPGNLNLTGSIIEVLDASFALIENQGENNGGNINVNASQRLTISGFVSGEEGSAFSTLVNYTSADGNAGNIIINAPQIYVRDRSEIRSTAVSDGNSGDVTLNASEFIQVDNSIIDDEGVTQGNSAIFSTTFSSGNTGIINISTPELKLLAGSIIRNSTFDAGNSGEININTQRLFLEDNAVISASLGRASGNGGNVIINATEFIDMVGSPRTSTEGVAIGASTTFGGTGDAGNVTINTPRLSLRQGAVIQSSTIADGNAGNITINASESVELSGFRVNSTFGIRPSSISSRGILRSEAVRNAFGLPDQVTGVSGAVTINTPNLQITDGAEVAVSHDSVGNSGELTIDADSIFLDSQGQITANTVSGGGGDITLQIQDSIIGENNSSISADVLGDGSGGNLDITTNNLQFNSGATISTNTTGSGNGGTINIMGNSLTFDGELTGVFSEAVETSTGDAGNINLTADLLSVTNNAQVSTNSEGLGQAGTVTIETNRLEANRGNITATSLQTGGGNLFLNVDDLLLSNQSLISTSVLDSTGGGGDITINSDFIFVRENSNIRANAVFGAGGNIQINTDTIFIAPDSAITASSEFGVDGLVTINNPDNDNSAALLELPKDTTDPSQQIAEGCAWVRNNSFIVTGRGGTPKNPTNILGNDQMWSDIRNLSNSQSDVTSHQSLVSESPLIEANTWIINEQGNVELVAIVNPQDLQNPFLSANCAEK